MAVTNEHQRIVDFLNRLLGIFVQAFGLGSVRSALCAMRATPDGSIREPDLMFVSAAYLDRVQREALDGPADLVVEGVLEESVARDYDQKFIEYQSAGVQEYWIVDPRPDRRRASFFRRDPQGRFQLVPVSEGSIYHAQVMPSLWLKLD